MLLYILATFTSMMKVILSCPVDLVEWNNRADDLKCDNQKSEYHHCMLDSDSNSVEICMQHALIKPGSVGCPWVHFRRTTPILGYPLLFCNSSQCPGPNHRGYYTDMLYLYPTCFEPASNRTSYSSSAGEAIKDIKPEVNNGSKPPSQTLNIIIIIAVVLALTNIVSIILVIWQRIKMKSEDSARSHERALMDEEAKT